MRQFTHRVARNTAFGMGGQLAIKLLSFGFSVLIVRRLGAADYGQYAGVLAFGAVFIFITDLGLSPYFVREVARIRDAPDAVERVNALYANVLSLRLWLSIPAMLLPVVLAWLTGQPAVMTAAIALNALSLLLWSVQGTSDAILAGFERLDLSAGAKVLNQIAFVLGGIVVLLLGAGYFGLILANMLGVALMALICWRSVATLGIRPRGSIARTWPRLLRASLPFGVIGLTLGLSYKFDSVLLTIFRDDVEIGYYNAAYNLVFSAAVLSNVLNTALYPSLARQAASAPYSLASIYERALRYLMAMALPVAVGGWALADQIMPFLFTETYLPAVPALQIVIWVVPLMFLSEFLGYIVLIRGNESRAARAVVASTSLNVMLNLMFVPLFGFLGAAVMTVVTEAVLVGQYVWMLRAQLRQLDWSRILARPLLAAVVMGMFVLALRAQMLLLNIALGALIYIGLLLVLGVIGGEELRFVRGLRQSTEGELSQ